MAKVKILELGSGLKPYPGKEGEEVCHLDKSPFPDVEVVWDLEKTPYPFPDSSFDKVIAIHCLEHISDTGKVMNEIWRIGKSGAQVHIRVPYYSSYLAFKDPTHHRFFTEETFNYYSGIFSLNKVGFIYFHPHLFGFLEKYLPRFLKLLRNHLLNIVKEMEIELVVKK